MPNYWFYRLKKVVPSQWSTERFDHENVEQDTFISPNRDTAKEYLHSKFGKLPFRKPKEAKENDLYLYLVPSTEYWYKRDHEELNVICDFCKTTTKVIGNKNVIRDARGTYCSEQCKEDNIIQFKNEDEWISKEDHLNINQYESKYFVGYIYKITNKITMKSYVGQTIKPPLFRWWQHLKVESKFEQVNLSDLVFEVIEVVTFDKNDGTDIENFANAKDKLNKRESYYIKMFDCVEEGYNEKY